MSYQEKINELYDDAENKYGLYSTWEIDFITDIQRILVEEDHLEEDEALTENQMNKIDELYDKHFGD